MNLSINVQLGEVLSRKDCADIVKHIIKFIVYNNQQIPYTYDGFQRIIARKKHLDERLNGKPNSNTPLSFKQIKANTFFETIENVFKTFEAIFQGIELELLSGSNLKEIVIILGTTVMSPKHVYRIRIPKLSNLDTGGQKLRSHLFRIYRSIITSRAEKNFSSSKCGLTNIYLLINGGCSTSLNSDRFVLKHGFRIPSSADQTFISFANPDVSDNIASLDNNDHSTEENVSSEVVIDPVSTKSLCSHPVDENVDKWFIAPQALRGFNDLKIDGVPFYNILLELAS
ncbi:Hypothetical protein NTJ_03963 [Nesidiocoris tenuis]|uniref:MAD2L1-binding protein n=1 Tax=Nesidiocoris tenuis TaxID=355587 RepID=A0ABN7AIX5_9HEMI|nr:Hypothetical protein NTJ_03963 [Nesidiocoris tenuis]